MVHTIFKMAESGAENDSNSFLFTREDGSPMVFVITPGVSKKKLRPIVENGGGVITSKATPGGIRLVEPEYKSDQSLISTDFVLDSFKNGMLCNIDDYRLENKPVVTSTSTPKANGTVKTENTCKGRIKYSPEEDQAILDYIKKFRGQDIKLSGNKIWQEMEEKKVTCHRWQSMRSHYLYFLRSNTSPQRGKLQFIESNSTPKTKLISNTAKTTSENVLNSRRSIFQPCVASKYPKKAQVSSVLEDIEMKEDGKSNTHNDGIVSNSRNVFQASVTSKFSKATQTYLEEIKKGDENDKLVLGSLAYSVEDDIETKDKDGENKDFPIVFVSDNELQISVYSENNSSTKNCNENIQEIECCNRRHESAQSNEKADLNSQSLLSTAKDMTKKHLFAPCIQGNDDVKTQGAHLRCEELFKSFKELQMTEQRFSWEKCLHALYISSGSLQDAVHYLTTGLLPNGQESWKKEEDLIISSGDEAAISEVISKRGQEAVKFRREFINSFT